MTLNEFKMAAQERPISLELLWRFGQTSGFAPWLCGPRRIVAVRSYGFDLALNTTEGLGNPEQKVSELRVKRAALFDCDGDTISIYKSGCRPATEEEQEVLDAWAEKMEKCQDLSWWSKKKFFRTFSGTKERKKARRNGYEYLIDNRLGKADPETGRELIRDHTVRGDLALKYRVIAA